MGDRTRTAAAVEWVCDSLAPATVGTANAFEVNIRVLGGLLSAHALLERCPAFVAVPVEQVKRLTSTQWARCGQAGSACGDVRERRGFGADGPGGVPSVEWFLGTEVGSPPPPAVWSCAATSDVGPTPGPDLRRPYDGCLLGKAVEVGLRLLPAFATTSGLPTAHVDMRTWSRDLRDWETNTGALCIGAKRSSTPNPGSGCW